MDLWQLSYDGINYIFEHHSMKEELQRRWQKWKGKNISN
jgi:hypothetical protein